MTLRRGPYWSRQPAASKPLCLRFGRGPCGSQRLVEHGIRLRPRDGETVVEHEERYTRDALLRGIDRQRMGDRQRLRIAPDAERLVPAKPMFYCDIGQDIIIVDTSASKSFLSNFSQAFPVLSLIPIL